MAKSTTSRSTTSKSKTASNGAPTPEKQDAAKNKPRAKAMGRGLGAILGDSQPVPESAPAQATSIYEVPIEQIEANPYQPRTTFDENALQELRASIEVHGIIQPLTVRRMGHESYQLIAGERRLRASKLAGLEKVPAFVREADNEQMLEFALIENIQRDDLNPVEVSLGYKRLMDECKLTIEAVGEKVGKKRATVNNYLRLLKLPPEIQAALRDKRLSMGHARALISIDNPVHQLELFNRVMQEGASVRLTEKWASEVGAPKPKSATSTPPYEKEKLARDAYSIQLQALRREFEDLLQTKVEFQRKGDEQGELRIHYYTLEELNHLLESLRESCKK